MLAHVLRVRREHRSPDARVALRQAQERAQPAADEALVDVRVAQVRRERGREELGQMAGQSDGAVVIVRVDELEPRAARVDELRDERMLAIDEPRLVAKESAA